MALEGLFPGEDYRKSGSRGLNLKYPKLADMLDFILGQQPFMFDTTGSGDGKLLLESTTFVAMIKFLLKCFEADAKENDMVEDTEFLDSVNKLCLLLEHAMSYEGSIQLHADASKAFITVATSFPQVSCVDFR